MIWIDGPWVILVYRLACCQKEACVRRSIRQTVYLDKDVRLSCSSCAISSAMVCSMSRIELASVHVVYLSKRALVTGSLSVKLPSRSLSAEEELYVFMVQKESPQLNFSSSCSALAC